MKELYREKDMVENISAIKFRFMSGLTVEQMSHMEVQEPVMYSLEQPGSPHPLGPLSRQLGVSTKDGTCSTCGQGVDGCPGHFGFIKLCLPCFHYGFFKNVVQIMQNICKSCSSLLLNDEQIAELTDNVQKYRNDYLKKKMITKKVNELCKKVKTCYRCGRPNGIVKRFGPIRITHEPFRGLKKDDASLKNYLNQYGHLLEDICDQVSNIKTSNPMEIYYPDTVLELLNKITAADARILCVDVTVCHPRDLILTVLPVAPNCIRPSVVSDLKRSGSNEDDITVMFTWISQLNNVLKRRMERTTVVGMFDIWEMLQIAVALLINCEVPMPPEVNMTKMKPSTCFVQRLKGKQGRFRGNLSGKRVDFSSRTVISPDPNLHITQVGVPQYVARTLTYPERVTAHNVELMRQLVTNGPDVHPGAVFVEQLCTTGIKKSVKHLGKKRHDLANSLRPGDIVERHLMDGDTVLFNRQPSLHKMSIMAHRAKVLPWKTFRFNECVCNPYNADFDGDEMNLHLPQTEEARAEAQALMTVTNNLVTPRSGALIIGATQDFITGVYMLTRRDAFFDRNSAKFLLLLLAEPGAKVEMPVPAIVKPKELWTGKQLFSRVLQFNSRNKVRVNLLLVCKDLKCNYRNELCLADGTVHIRNSELLSGTLDKSMIGAGSKNNIFYALLKDYGKEEAAAAMWRVARISIGTLSLVGFSVGAGDLSPSASLVRMKSDVLSHGYDTCTRYIVQHSTGQLECAPGCNSDETLEQIILSELSKIRDSAGKACIEELQKDNSALIMAVSGSKGSIINISQMIACVGQQAINGKRVPEGFTNRSLPYFRSFSKLPEAKGFVSDSFYTGLTPSEFLYHTMGGREGLVDTAVKTAETGYMQRRLVKCLEDLYVAYDGTVRNCTQDVIQFQYGDDGLDPTHVETTARLEGRCLTPPLNFERIFYHVKAVKPPIDDLFMTAQEVVNHTKSYLNDINKDLKLPKRFIRAVRRFIREESKKMRKAELVEHKIRQYNAKQSSDVSSDIRGSVVLRPLTVNQLVAFLMTVVNRYTGSSVSSDNSERLEAGPGILMEAGTGVGALCAQSIGEPATQMTLKTFHFAGVAAMNITLGVPRIKEIINATRVISTPIITAQLLRNDDLSEARKVKARIEQTRLGEVCKFIKWINRENDSLFIIKLATEHIKLLQLHITAYSVKYSILNSKMKVREQDIYVHSRTILLVRPNLSSNEDPYHQMNTILKQLPLVVVAGLSNISRAVIHQRSGQCGRPEYELLVEGDNLLEVLGTRGVYVKTSKSNNILEVERTLGIEAARKTIIEEITETMSSHGLSVDCRHVNLLADAMTCRGAVHGITRHGLAKTNDSVLTLASFEKTAEHLFEAAYHGQVSEVDGVSDCIIMGKPISLGTGLFKLVQRHQRSDGDSLLRLNDDEDDVQSNDVDAETCALSMARSGSTASSASSAKLTLNMKGQITKRRFAGTRMRELWFDSPEFHPPMRQ